MSHLMSNYLPLDVTFVSGEGCWLTDDKGQQYLDCLSGVGVVNLGHCHPVISKAISEQANTLLHTSNWYHIENQEVLAERLCNSANMDKVFFGNSGAEANEAAIKIARLHGKSKDVNNPIILTANQSFHGRTMATLSATGNEKVQAGFSPLVSEFIHIDFNDVAAIQAFEGNSNVVAVMLEPIQGESGVIIPSNNYLSDVQTICNNNDWLFILDEVQTGIGRTGELFAHQHSNITPDVMTLAKGLGNGVPIGACLTKGPANKMLTPGTHGSTFGGNPLVSKVALGVLDIFHKDNILDNVKTRSEQISTQLNNALKGNVKVKEIRIKGLMIAIELNADCSTLLQSALEDRLLINITGNSIRMLPPLVINQQEVDIMLEKVIKLINNTSE